MADKPPAFYAAGAVLLATLLAEIHGRVSHHVSATEVGCSGRATLYTLCLAPAATVRLRSTDVSIARQTPQLAGGPDKKRHFELALPDR